MANTQQNHTVEFHPIEEAPVRPGEEWGPVLVYPSESGWFAFGKWDGRAFYNEVTGALIEPHSYAELPESLGSVSSRI